MGDNEENSENETGEDMRVAVPFDEQDARTIAIADAPADKVGVRLTTEGPFDHVFDQGQGRWVCCVLEGVEDGGTVTMREVELARRVGGEVVADDPIDLRTKGLDGDYPFISIV